MKSSLVFNYVSTLLEKRTAWAFSEQRVQAIERCKEIEAELSPSQFMLANAVFDWCCEHEYDTWSYPSWEMIRNKISNFERA